MKSLNATRTAVTAVVIAAMGLISACGVGEATGGGSGSCGEVALSGDTKELLNDASLVEAYISGEARNA